MTYPPAIIILLIIVLAITAWIRGYTKSDYFPPDTTVKFFSTPIALPWWLYLICGAPKSQKYPKGVVTAWAFAAQLSGIGLFIHLFVAILLKQDNSAMLLNLTIVVSLVYGITYWLARKNVYNPPQAIED